MLENTISLKKSIYREQVLLQRRKISPQEKSSFDLRILNYLSDYYLNSNYNSIHCYVSRKDEVDTRSFIKKVLNFKHKNIIVPEVIKKPRLKHVYLKNLNDLVLGPYGTQHPKSSVTFKGTLDLIIVPGLAFDHKGNRIGYGGGYYDHFLKDQLNVPKIALAYPFQIFDKLPTNKFDIPVDRIICPADKNKTFSIKKHLDGKLIYI
jgi:5-formyltetrahydrofolate cyclo-ligase